MYNKLFSLIILLGLFSSSLQAQKFQLPEYEKVTLKNGLVVYLMEQHEVPLINVSVALPAGTVHEPEAKSGLASVTADALMFGAGKRSKQELEAALDYVGAGLSTYADKERATVRASFAIKDSELVLGILHDLLVEPQFNAEEWEKLKTRRMVEYDQAKESPRSVIGDYYDAFVYNEHPYARSARGTKASLQDLSIADIKQFYEKQYAPEGSALAIVGDFETSEMKKKLQSLFKDWKGEATAEEQLASLPEQQQSRVLIVNKPDANETTFLIGGPGIPRNHPDYVAIQVINTLLGGRFTSWLNDELRVNSGLTYGARSIFDSYREGGAFVISTFTKTESTKEAIDLALKTYNRLHEKGIDENTLESAKNYVKGQYPPRFETGSSLAGLLTDMHWYGFDEEFINTFRQKVDQLDVEEANRIAQTYFPKENLQFVLVGRADDIRDMAKAWGDVQEKEIEADGF